MKLTAKKAWGIEVGSNGINAVLLSHNKDGLSVDACHEVPFQSYPANDEERESMIISALQEFIVKAGIKKNDLVVTSLPGQHYRKPINLPPVEMGRVPEIVQYEARQQIPFPIDEVIWDYHLLNPTPDIGEEIEVVIFAARTEDVYDRLALFNAAQLKVRGIQVTSLALFNYICADRPDDEQALMIIDIQSTSTDVMVREGNRFYSRPISIGGDNITKALMNKFNIPFAQAEELKRNMATSKQAAKIYEVMKPIFRDLVREIKRSLNFYKSRYEESQLSEVLLIGDAFRLSKLVEYLQVNLNMTVKRLDAMKQFTEGAALNDVNQNISSMCVPLGLALQGVGQASCDVNLIPAPIIKADIINRKKPLAVVSACLLLASATISFLGVSQAQSVIEESEKLMKSGSHSVKALSERNTLYNENLDKIAPARNRMLGLIPWANTDVQHAASRELWSLVWQKISEILPDNESDTEQRIFLKNAKLAMVEINSASLLQMEISGQFFDKGPGRNRPFIENTFEKPLRALNVDGQKLFSDVKRPYWSDASFKDEEFSEFTIVAVVDLETWYQKHDQSMNELKSAFLAQAPSTEDEEDNGE